METIGLREFNQNPSQVVARVRVGTSILVMECGEPVLRMIPEPAWTSMLQRMVVTGEVEPPSENGMPEVIAELGDLPVDLGFPVDSPR
jgi:antitoxin (DNA-binding transcriptional repressor) of toxin-antitoxin stability system